MARWLRLSLVSLTCTVALLAIVAAGGLVWLNTKAGRDFVLKTAAGAVGESGLEVAFKGVEGRLLDEIRIESATLADPRGVWLQIDRLVLRWTPAALLLGRVQIDAIEAARVDVLRVPALPPTPDSETGAGPPSIPLAISLGRLGIDRLVLHEAFAGPPAELTLSASAAVAREAARLALDVRRLDRPGAIRARLGYDLARNALDLALEAEEPKGGVIAELAGLPGTPALRAVLEGKGPLSDWAGRLHVTADGADWINLEGSVEGQNARQVAISGTVGLRPLASDTLLPPDLLPVIGESLALEATATITDRELSLDRASIAAEAMALGLSGRFVPDTQRWSARMDVLRLSPELLARYGVALGQPVIRAEAEGAGGRVDASLRIGAGRLAAAGVTAEAVEAVVDAVRPGPDEPVTLAVRLDARMTALPGGKTAAPMLGPASLRAQAAIRGSAVELRDLSLHAGPAMLQVSGRYAGDTARANISAAIRDIGAFAGGADPALEGAAQLDAKLRYGRSDGLAVDDLVLRLPQGRVTGQAALGPAFKQTTASLEIPGLALESVSPLLGMPVAGKLAGTLAVSGPVADPAAELSLRLSGGEASGNPLPPLELEADARQLVSGPRGAVALLAHPPQGEMRLRSRFALADSSLDLTGIALSGPGIAADGRLSLDLGRGAATGALRLDARDLGPVLDIAGLGGGGSVNAEILLETRKGVQTARISGEATSIALVSDGKKMLSLGRASVEASGGAGSDSPVSARLNVVDLTGGGAEIGEIVLEADGTLARLRFDLDVSAPAYRQLEAAIDGVLRSTSDAYLLRLTGGSGSVMDRPFTISPGMEAAVGRDTYRLSDLVVSGPELGRLEFSGRLAKGRIEADADIRDVPLALIAAAGPGPGWAGRLSLSAHVSGTLERPLGEVTANAVGVRLPDDSEAPEGNIVFQVKLDRKAAVARLRVAGLSKEPLVGRVRLGRGAAGLGFGDESSLSGTISWNGRIETLTRLMPLVGQRAAGNIGIDAAVGGTLGAPRAKGTLLVTDALVEAYATGTVLSLPRVEVVASERSIVLQPFDAQVAGGGGLSGRGTVELDAAAGFPLSVGLELRNARLVNRDGVTAILSGRVSATGSLDAPQILARLTSDRIEIRADIVAPPSVTTLEVTEVGAAPEHGLPEPAPTDGGGASASDIRIGLDVALQMPQEVFVRGRGLDSEWRGNIEVTGTTADPRVIGQLSSVRGQIDVIGKIFELRPSTIDIAPNASGGVDALLAITAVHEGEDIGVTVMVTGPATQPKLTLTSTPALPQEEILSRLLFGKSRAELTAVEAIQLAQAVSSLAGGGGPDPIAAIRKAIGVDVLRLDAGGEAGPAVETGKYLTKDVYVGVRQGTDAGSGAVTVEIDVLDNVVVESELRQDGSSSVGAKYEFDY